MIDQTNSFKRLKKETQQILDFAILVCYSVPGLKKLIKAKENSIKGFANFHKSDYFKENVDIERLKSVSRNYKPNLSKYILISAFSFFEAYFKNLISELIEFHGGEEEFLSQSIKRRKNAFANNDPEFLKHKSKLQTTYKKKNWQRYEKYQNQLDEVNGFRYGCELLATYGIKKLIETIKGQNFKSVIIPEILEIAFGLPLHDKINQHSDLLEKDLKETFHIIRDWRNSIGHGSANDIGIEKVMDMIRFLRFFSLKIDRHLIDHFFVIERGKCTD